VGGAVAYSAACLAPGHSRQCTPVRRGDALRRATVAEKASHSRGRLQGSLPTCPCQRWAPCPLLGTGRVTAAEGSRPERKGEVSFK